jgi:hypothetical protein
MNNPRTDHASMSLDQPAGRSTDFGDILLEPEEDEYLDRCLFEIRESLPHY